MPRRGMNEGVADILCHDALPGSGPLVELASS
jgi:hypothetical protein